MLAEGTNGLIPKMPFEKLCDLLAEAIKVNALVSANRWIARSSRGEQEVAEIYCTGSKVGSASRKI